MRITKTKVEQVLVAILLTFILLTYLQAYYVAYVPMIIFVMCYFFMFRYHRKVDDFIVGGIFTVFVFLIISLLNGQSIQADYISLFMHYMIWPVLLGFTVYTDNVKFIRKILWLTLIICLVGDIASLIEVKKNPDILRLMAGTMPRDFVLKYYKFGVGGYGYVFSMAFLTYGIIRWIRMSTKRFEKFCLSVFLTVNIIFIIKASYTIAILLTLILSILALVASKKDNNNIIILLLIIIVAMVFGKTILKGLITLADNFDLSWVSTRLNQLLYAKESNNISSLRRYELYSRSWYSFIEKPLLGGGAPGGHSEILDALAVYGISGILLVVFFKNCIMKCSKIIKDKSVIIMYIVFLIFACIDVCAAKQFPCILFYVIPLIIFLGKKKSTL